MTEWNDGDVAMFQRPEDPAPHVAIRRDFGWKDGQWRVAINGFWRVSDEFITQHGTRMEPPTMTTTESTDGDQVDWKTKCEKALSANIVSADRWKRVRASMQAEMDDMRRELDLLRPAVKAAEQARDKAQDAQATIKHNALAQIKLLTDRRDQLLEENQKLQGIVAEGRVAFMRELGEKLFGFIGTEK